MGLSSLAIDDKYGLRAVELVKHCPNLRYLRATLGNHFNRDNMLHQLAQHYTSGHPSRLEHLEILKMQGPLPVVAMDDLLKACAWPSGLKTLRLYRLHVPGSTIRALSTYHAKSLESLLLIDCNAISSSDLSCLVTKCSQLKCIEVCVKVNEPWLQDLVRSPWVCADLRNIRMDAIPGDTPLPESEEVVSTMSSNDDNEERIALVQRRFWSQIGALKNLKTLQLKIGL
ncbi:hypothetical protein BGZ65_006620 [Modicella reniformis]|uniref:Uncharacterized protein n=1 Tax=Modicella reniformis TaxID=1440133 RepID=A0A9P6JHY6_9FUNG|nr:hypothetical protein BGZ65_006620 [Modicella reniformis]